MSDRRIGTASGREAAAVRRAGPADLTALVALWTALHEHHAALDARYALTDDAPRRWAADAREWLRSDADRVWAAERDGALDGFATAHRTSVGAIYRAPEVVYLDDLFVMPRARGEGLGRALVEAVAEWAREIGASEIRLGVLAANAEAEAFWRRAGAAPVALTMALPAGAGH